MHSSFAEICAVMARYDTHSNAAATERLDSWLASIQRQPALLQHPRLAVYSGTDSRRFREAYTDPAAPVPSLCGDVDADLRLYELGQAFQAAGAGEAAAATTLCYGMMAVEPGVDCLLLCGDDRLDAAVAAALLEQAASKSAPEILTLLLKLQDAALYAAIGAVMAAYFARLPLLVEGVTAALAAALFGKLHAAIGAAAYVNPPSFIEAAAPRWIFAGKPLGYAALLALQEVQLAAAERYAGVGSA